MLKDKRLTDKRRSMSNERAAEIGVAALGYLADQPEALSRFLQLSGISLPQLLEEAETPIMQSALLEHLLQEESLLLAFAGDRGLSADEVANAAAWLGGYERSY